MRNLFFCLDSYLRRNDENYDWYDDSPMAKKTRSKSTTTLDATMRVVILHGKESYLHQQYTKQIVAALENAHGEIEQFGYDGKSADATVVLDELRSYGLMQQHKLVIVDNADSFLSAGDGTTGGKLGARKLMEKYAASPVETATLLLRAETWRPGNLDKAVKKIGAVIKCESPSAADAAKWCTACTKKQYDAEIEREAIQLLIDRIGPELGRLDSELMKLATLVGAGGTIQGDHVREMVGMTREDVAWSIQNAICSGQPGVALEKLHELVHISRVDLVPITWSIVDLSKKVHAASAMRAERVSPGVISKQLRLWGPMQRVVLDLADRLSPKQAAQLLQHAIDCDRRNKSGFGEQRRNVEALAMLAADTIGTG